MTTAQQYTESKVNVNGMGIHLVDWGNHHLPSKMLWVHHMSGTGHYWDMVAPRFRDTYNLVCPTLRGRGLSDRAADGSYTGDDYLADLHALVEHLGWQRFVYVGNSLGGLVGIRYASTYPEQVERLVLVDVGDRIGGGQPQQPSPIAEPPETLSSLEEGEAFLRQSYMFAHLDEPAMRLVVREGFKKTPQGQWTWTYDPVLQEQRRRALAAGRLFFPDERDDARRVTCPTLIIRGARSETLTPGILRETMQAIKDCRLVEVPECGHLPHLEQRDHFVQALTGFLTEG